MLAVGVGWWARLSSPGGHAFPKVTLLLCLPLTFRWWPFPALELRGVRVSDTLSAALSGAEGWSRHPGSVLGAGACDISGDPGNTGSCPVP